MEKKPVDKMKVLTEVITGFKSLEEPISSEFEQQHGLAQAYAIKGFRDYLERCIKSSVTAVITVENMEDLYFNRGRILVLKELLGICKKKFEESEKLGINKK